MNECETSEALPSVLAILGPTASGKSELGLELAERLGGEIVCCDSMQVYRGLDIGTGKPTSFEQARVPHHLLDVAEPDEAFHAGAWARLAKQALRAIAARGRLPVIVGGTGLYFRALTQGLFEAPPPSPEIRARHKAEAETNGVAALHARLVQVDPAAAAKISATDLVRTSRALEVWEQTGVPITVHWQRAKLATSLRCFRVIYDRPLPVLRGLIDRRVDAMMAAGFLDEVERLRHAGHAGARALAGLGYKELGQHLNGAWDLPTAVAETKKNTAAYARRQRTWFRAEVAEVRLSEPTTAAPLLPLLSRWLAAAPTVEPGAARRV